MFIVDGFKNIFESSVIFLQNGIFGTEVNWIIAEKSIFEGRVSEFFNRLICVIHTHSNSWAGKFVDFICNWFSSFSIGSVYDFKLT